MKGHISKPNDWKKIPKRTLKQGIKFEYEHTKSMVTARRIASDHIMEYPKYYTYLARMEEKLEKMKRKNIKPL